NPAPDSATIQTCWHEEVCRSRAGLWPSRHGNPYNQGSRAGLSGRAGSHSQRISDCGLFSHLHAHFQAPFPCRKFNVFAKKNQLLTLSAIDYVTAYSTDRGLEVRLEASRISKPTTLPFLS